MGIMAAIIVIMGILVVPCDTFHFLCKPGSDFQIEAGGFESDTLTRKFGPFVSSCINPSYKIEMVDVF